jgi:hypothetical protein
MSSDLINDEWTKLRTLVDSIEVDVKKNIAGNASAGIRARRGLREIKKSAAALIKITVDAEKTRKEG